MMVVIVMIVMRVVIVVMVVIVIMMFGSGCWHQTGTTPCLMHSSTTTTTSCLMPHAQGHDNHHHENIYAFVGGCMGVGSFLPGHEDEFSRNKCILTSDRAYASFACSRTSLPIMYNNTVFTPRGLPFEMCGHDFPDWQKMGHDVGTTVHAYPQWNGSIVAWAKDLIFV